MSEDNGFDKHKDAVHGKGTLEPMWKVGQEITLGAETEGNSEKISAA